MAARRARETDGDPRPAAGAPTPDPPTDPEPTDPEPTDSEPTDSEPTDPAPRASAAANLPAPNPAKPRTRTRTPVLLRGQGTTLAVVAAGGALGGAARYGASLIWPTAPGTFPWTTLAVNVVGCAAMGVLMVVITEGRQAHRLVRPFLGTGVLGGFTTFSTYAVDIERLVDLRAARTALGYLALTLIAALAAVWLAATATRRALNVTSARPRPRPRPRRQAGDPNPHPNQNPNRPWRRRR